MMDREFNLTVLNQIKAAALRMDFVKQTMADPMNITRFMSKDHEKIAIQVIRNHFNHLLRKSEEDLNLSFNCQNQQLSPQGIPSATNRM